MAGSNHVHDDAIAEINIVPLVDVVLVLLIIFMLTAPLLQRTIDIRLPEARTAQLAESKRLILTVTGKGLVYFDKYAVAWTAVEDHIRTQAPTWKDRSVYLQADSSVPYEKVVHILDILRHYGITKIGLMTRPVSEH